MRTGFVPSGFASFAATQVGMLRALISAGKVPDVVVGVSMGAGNAVWLAARPTAAGVEDLQRAWLEIGRHDVPPFTPPVAVRAFLESLSFQSRRRPAASLWCRQPHPARRPVVSLPGRHRPVPLSGRQPEPAPVPSREPADPAP